MPDFTLIVSLIGGLVLLAFSGDFLVNGAVSLARRMGVSPLVAGIFIVGFGTSAPEMLVALNAAQSGYPELALGNIVGSNIANIWLVLALPAVLAPVYTGAHGQRMAALSMLITTLAWITVASTKALIPGMGALFIMSLFIYSGVTFTAMRGQTLPDDLTPLRGILTSLGLVLIGFVGLPIGAHLIVEGGVGLARTFNISEELIGLTLLAIGTSLPEIGAGVAAALRQRTDVLVGNVLGSNIFNILGAGGLVAFFGPIEMAPTFGNYDHWVMVGAAGLLALFILLRIRIGRLLGLLMLLFYTAYIIGLVNGWNIAAMVLGETHA